jgi:hypothetical protein
MHHHPLRLAQEFTVLEAAYEAGVKVPRLYGYVAGASSRSGSARAMSHRGRSGA